MTVEKAGGPPRYTEIADAKHNCWDEAYATAALWNWLREQRRQ